MFNQAILPVAHLSENPVNVTPIRATPPRLPDLKYQLPPLPDRQKANQLTITWLASDKNLRLTPVNLEFAEKKEGPWYPIKVEQPNTGKYDWELPDGLPIRIFIRIRVKDLAGNENIAGGSEPFCTDLGIREALTSCAILICRR